MAGKPKTRKLLDSALENFQHTSLALSKRVKAAVRHISPDADFTEIAKATKLVADSTKIYVELAPFFALRQSIEGTDHFREWILHSTDYAGDSRTIILQALHDYQQAITADAGFLEHEQYQLL